MSCIKEKHLELFVLQYEEDIAEDTEKSNESDEPNPNYLDFISWTQLLLINKTLFGLPEFFLFH